MESFIGFLYRPLLKLFVLKIWLFVVDFLSFNYPKELVFVLRGPRLGIRSGKCETDEEQKL